LNQELEFNGIEVGKDDRVNNRQQKLSLFKLSLIVAFCGSVAANMLIIGFFCFPIAIGWHFAIFWLCLAWAVLGAERFLIRTSAALLVWVVGTLPILWWQEMLNPDTGPSLLNGLWVALVPSYLALWLFRAFQGNFTLRSNQASFSVDPTTTKMQLSVFELLSLTMLCGVLLVIVPAIAASVLEFERTVEFVWPGLAMVGVVALFPLIQMTCLDDAKSLKRPFLYLLVVSFGLVALLLTPLLLVLGPFFQPADASTLFIVFALLPLLSFSSAGAFVIVGLIVIRDHQYRVG
jgi:hypothetical protein